MPKTAKKIAVRGFQVQGGITVVEQSESQVVQRIFIRTNFFLIERSEITKKFDYQISTSDKFIQSFRRYGYERRRPEASPDAEEKACL